MYHENGYRLIATFDLVALLIVIQVVSQNKNVYYCSLNIFNCNI